jgi:hypothetical protein
MLLLSFRGGEPQQPLPNGHLVLVVEGDVTALRVSHAAHKQEPCGQVPKGLQSEFRLAVVDAAGVELCSQPIDLSLFDTDPLHIGRPVQVTGCIVKDWRIALLVNVPDYPQADRLVFWRGKQQLGALSQRELQQLLGGGK